MRKLITFFVALVLLVLTFIALYFSGLVYDTGAHIRVEPFFFEPNNLSSQRLAIPKSPEELGQHAMMKLLIERFVTEYFYVIPDSDNVAKRMKPGSVLYNMSYASTTEKRGKTRVKHLGMFDKWLADTAPEIKEMSERNMLRLVKLLRIHKPSEESKYLLVDYELKTWNEANNLALEPKITRGTMYLRAYYVPGIPERVINKGISKFLKKGGDPAGLFNFKVREVRLE